MNYGIAEQEIAAWLNAKFEEINISHIYEAAPVPENEADAAAWYNKINKARATIEYLDSTYDPDSGNDTARIEERVRFKVTFESRIRRGIGGIYTIMELVKLFAIGFKPSNADRLTVVRGERHFVGENAIQLSIDLECKTLNLGLPEIIAAPPIEQGAVFKEAEFLERFHN